MAKKFVRGITDVKTITNQCYDTNNVNDLLSDGQYNYIHRKKGKNEEYHNLTDNIKTLSSDNTELLSVTNNNKTTNTATLHPKHDAQKEQLLESTRDTITINHGTNGTAEKTTVDTNPQKVLEHENLISNSQYVTIEHEEDSNTSEIKTDKLNNTINELNSKIETVDEKIPTIIGGRNYLRGTSDKYQTFTSDSYILGPASTDHDWPKLLAPLRGKTVTLRAYIKNDTDYPVRIQVYTNTGSVNANIIPPHSEGWSVGTGKMPSDWTGANVSFVQDGDGANNGGTIQAKEAKLEIGNIPSDWSPAPEDTQKQLNTSLAQKQDKLTAGDGITIDETTIMFKATKKPPETNLNTLGEGVIYGEGFSIDQVPGEVQDTSAAYVTINTSDNKKVQFYIREQSSDYGKIRLCYRFISNGEVTEWQKMPGDRGELNYELAQKQDSLQSSASIGVINNTLRQLYTLNQTYTHANGSLKTHVKSVSLNTNLDNAEEEFNFILKINQGQQSATFTLNEHDKTKFNNIITAYGASSTVKINGVLFELSNSTLTVSTDANTSNNQVITFSDII